MIENSEYYNITGFENKDIKVKFIRSSLEYEPSDKLRNLEI